MATVNSINDVQLREGHEDECMLCSFIPPTDEVSTYAEHLLLYMLQLSSGQTKILSLFGLRLH